ncbi:hypothetical protein PAMP_020428 [Pampus punctatissimus]
MALKSYTVLLVVAAAFCMELHQAQDVLGRCSCPVSVLFVRNRSDFQVIEKQPGCDKIEIIITETLPDNSTRKVCLKPEGMLGKAFLQCWEKINKDESRKMECMKKGKKSK